MAPDPVDRDSFPVGKSSYIGEPDWIEPTLENLMIPVNPKKVLGWKGPLKPISPNSMPWAGTLQQVKVAQGLLQTGLEYFQEWDIHHHSGQPAPAFHNTH